MKRPSLFTRLLGNPVAACVMCVWLLYSLAGLSSGHTPVFETIVASGFVFRSLRAWRTMRGHRAWLRQWNDTGQMEQGKSQRISADGRGNQRKSAMMIFVPGLLLIILLIGANSARPDELPVLALLSFACAVWLVVVIPTQKFRKHGRGEQAQSLTKAEAENIVSWVSGPARSAPSREYATSNLPGYALAVMGYTRTGQDRSEY